MKWWGGGGGGVGVFFFKQKTAYEILTCDWSSDVCSSDLLSTCSQSQHIIQQSANQRAAPVYNGEQSLSASVQSTSRQQLGAEGANVLTQLANAETDHTAPFTRK